MKIKYLVINWSTGNDFVYCIDQSIPFFEVEEAFYNQHHGKVNIYLIS